MKNQPILTKTGKGTRTLQHCEAALSANECRFLALVNGKFSFHDIQSRLPAMSEKECRSAAKILLEQGYVKQLSLEGGSMEGPSTIVGVTELDTEHGVREWAAATRAAEALNSQGYYLTREEKSKCKDPKQILVIDDEASIGDAVSIVLGGAGFAVEALTDSREAISKMLAMPCLALVLLDVLMPHENGFAVLRRIRSQRSLQKLPVVMLTAHANPEYVAEGLKEGADGYILKPFRPEKLIVYLQDTLKAH